MHIIFYKSFPVLSCLLVPVFRGIHNWKLCDILCSLYGKSSVCVWVGEHHTVLFVSNVGVFQGDVLSTNLFILLMTYLPI